VGLHQVCIGFVVVVVVGEGACIGLPRCGVVEHIAFMISFEDELMCFFEVLAPAQHITVPQYESKRYYFESTISFLFILCWP
jgi:hypothetical protein